MADITKPSKRWATDVAFEAPVLATLATRQHHHAVNPLVAVAAQSAQVERSRWATAALPLVHEQTSSALSEITRKLP